MSLSKISQLNVASWTCSSDALLKAYRGYANEGKICSKGQLLKATALHSIRTVAYGALSSFGALVYCFSLGKASNKPW